ncbi:MAG TPA: thioredoxin [Prolixibacteraceae bacterium]|jgi:thioredoxin
MKKLLISLSLGLVLLLGNCLAGNPVKPSGTVSSSAPGTVIVMNEAMFKQKVFNYGVNKEWKYEGTMPAIIDFYADWCGPCRMLSPRVEEIAKQYAGKIVVYKVNTDDEQVLSQNMGISSLPTLLFIPIKGIPQASMGLVPKATLEKAIREVLLIE